MQATPSFYTELLPPCWAVFIANNWGKAATLTVSWNGTDYDVTKFGRIPVAGEKETDWATVPATGIPVGQVAILFISSDPMATNLAGPTTCPVADAIDESTAIPADGEGNATGVGEAWHIVADVPVTAYDILPYGGAKSFLPSAELLLPTSAWGLNYVAVVPVLGSPSPGSAQVVGPQWAQIVAATDKTTVKIVPVVNLPTGIGVAGAAAGVVTTFNLNAGQYIQWQNSEEMSGSVISSDQPIGVNGGNASICYQSPTSTHGGCDSAHQEIPPVAALGFEYVAQPYTTRRKDLMPESIPYRLVGAVNGTTLDYDPAVSGAPATLAEGQVVDFDTTLAFTVTSQDNSHPFYVAQRMTGCGTTSGSRPGDTPGGFSLGSACLGDEEFVNILPPAQFLTKYTFFTDPTYGTTNLVFVRDGSAAGFQDVSLDCLGVLTGWQPIGTSGKYESTNVDLVRAAKSNGSCTNGPHTATSAGTFGIMVWGEDYASSYAYPAGGNVTPINAVVVQPNPH
jgi:hypothetical protein